MTATTKKKKKKKKKKEKNSKTGKTSMAGTLEYFSPELLEFHAGIGADTEGSHLGTPADIWALGVLAFTCLEGYHPFSPNGFESHEDIFRNIMYGR